MRTWSVFARRYGVICAFGLWLGGTTLYTGFVIPVGHRVFASAEFGAVTQEVTRTLNRIGVVAVAILFWNCWADRRLAGRFLLRASTVTLLSLTVSTMALFAFHEKLDSLLTRPTRWPKAAGFDSWHEAYKVVTAIQWACGLLHLGSVLAVWRRADRVTPDRTG